MGTGIKHRTHAPIYRRTPQAVTSIKRFQIFISLPPLPPSPLHFYIVSAIEPTRTLVSISPDLHNLSHSLFTHICAYPLYPYPLIPYITLYFNDLLSLPTTQPHYHYPLFISVISYYFISLSVTSSRITL